MSNRSPATDYPHGLDIVWLACNRAGQVAALVTAGAGPMPQGAILTLAAGLDPETEIARLPPFTTPSLRVAFPREDSYLTLGSRGFYVFDWPDAGPVNEVDAGPYHLVCVPQRAISVDELPSALQLVARANVLDAESFVDVDFVWVTAHAN
jgi:hypothetical protein